MRFGGVLTVLAACLLLTNGCRESTTNNMIGETATWSDIESMSEDTTVRMGMWDGDPLINAFMRDYVKPRLMEQHGIRLEIVGGQGSVFVNKLLVELDAGKLTSDIDLIWINGENFYQLRNMDGLYGPFTHMLPNSALVDWTDPFIAVDFQQPIAGYECPWGNVQLAIIYDPERVDNPPQNKEEIAAWVRANPGRFTFDNSFTGMTFLKSILYDFAEDKHAFHGAFDEATYVQSSQKLWQWLRGIKPYLWKQGETFPEGVAQLHRLFMNNELDFTMSNNDGEVDNKVSQGVLPANARAYVLRSGTIRNSHYLGIPVNAPNKAAALVLTNFLISPEAQLQKAMPDIWGDGTVLDITKLNSDWQTKFANIPGRVRIPPRDELKTHALMEPAPEVMLRLYEDFRKEIIER